MGGELSCCEFARYLVLVEAQIDAKTQNRVRADHLKAQDLTLIPYAAKLEALVFELIAVASVMGGRQVISESSDGLSVTFAAMNNADDALRKSRLISQFLFNHVDGDGTPLLYIGGDEL